MGDRETRALVGSVLLALFAVWYLLVLLPDVIGEL